MVATRAATEEYPGLLEGAGAPGAVATKEAWKSEIVAAMAIWSTAFNTNWPNLTITFVEAPNSDGGYEKPNNIALGDVYDLPHEKGIGDLRFGRHQISGAKAHGYQPHGTLGEAGGWGGDMHFNLTDLSWRRDSDSGDSGGNSIRRTAAHELGHAFGLGHTTYASTGASVMFVDFPSGVGPPMTLSMSDFSNAIPPSDLACLKTLYEDGTVSPDCNTSGAARTRWQKIVDAIAGGDVEEIIITYSFYADSPVPKLHQTGSGKLASSGTKAKYHDQSEADLCCGDCVYCEDGKAPKAWKVKIKGFKNTAPPHDDCTTCSVDYNKTFIVPRDDLPGDAACRWDVEFSDLDECYDHYSIGVTIAGLPGSYALNVGWFTSTRLPLSHGRASRLSGVLC